MARELTKLNLNQSSDKIKQDILDFMHESIALEIQENNLEPLIGFHETFTHNGQYGEITFHSPTDVNFIERTYRKLNDQLNSFKSAPFHFAAESVYNKFVSDELFSRTEHLTYDLELNAEYKDREFVKQLRYEAITQDFASKHANVAAAAFFYSDFLKLNKEKILAHFKSFDNHVSNETYDHTVDQFAEKGFQMQLTQKEQKNIHSVLYNKCLKQ